MKYYSNSLFLSRKPFTFTVSYTVLYIICLKMPTAGHRLFHRIPNPPTTNDFLGRSSGQKKNRNIVALFFLI